MRPEWIDPSGPIFDQHACLIDRKEYILPMQLVGDLPGEPFAVTILAETPRFDVQRLAADPPSQSCTASSTRKSA